MIREFIKKFTDKDILAGLTLLELRGEWFAVPAELNKLYNEYFTNSDMKDMPLFKLENMYKDFKIIISMISDFKSNENASAQIIKSKSENEMKKTSSNNNNLIEI